MTASLSDSQQGYNLGVSASPVRLIFLLPRESTKTCLRCRGVRCVHSYQSSANLFILDADREVVHSG
jgi:hypothetical protein